MMFMNINELDEGVDAMYEVYARAREFNNIKATLDALLKAGWPRHKYDEYMKLAEEQGLFANGFSGKDILQPPPPGFARYGEHLPY